MIRRAMVLVATFIAALSLAGAAVAAWGGTYVGASPGAYAQTGTTYTTGFDWTRAVGGGSARYSWYIFTGGGTLQASGIGVTYPHASWYAGWNNRYWKFYNGSAGVQGFNVFWTLPG